MATTTIAPGPQSTVITTATGWTLRTWLLLITLGGVLFLDGLDLSMIGVALPDIRSDLGMSTTTAQWLVSGYILGYGGFLLLGGRACDLVGRRQVFLAAVLVFGIASVISAFLSMDALLIGLRFIKGVAAAFTVPAGLSIITTTFAEGNARNKAFSIYTVCGASGFSLGLVSGGLLTELSWRATLLFPGPVALILFVIGMKVIPHAASEPFSFAKFDLAGALTSTGSLLVLVFTVVRAPDEGWGSALTIGGFVLAVALMVSFVAIELRHRHPLVRLAILRSRLLVHANLSGLVMFGGYAAFQLLVTVYVQEQLGWSAIGMAMAFLPTGIIVLASAPRIDRILNRFDSRLLIGVGLSAFAAGYALFLTAQPGQSYWQFMFPTMLLLGLAFAVLFPAVNAQATAGVADHEQGLASGLLNTCIQVGGAVMIAVVTAVTAAAQSNSTPNPAELPPGMHTALWVVLGITVVGLVLTLAVARHRPVPRAVEIPAV